MSTVNDPSKTSLLAHSTGVRITRPAGRSLEPSNMNEYEVKYACLKLIGVGDGGGLKSIRSLESSSSSSLGGGSKARGDTRGAQKMSSENNRSASDLT